MTHRSLRITLLAVALMAVAGGVQGARLLAAAGPESAVASGRIETHGIRGRFWLPAGSIAERPPLRLAQLAPAGQRSRGGPGIRVGASGPLMASSRSARSPRSLAKRAAAPPGRSS